MHARENMSPPEKNGEILDNAKMLEYAVVH